MLWSIKPTYASSKRNMWSIKPTNASSQQPAAAAASGSSSSRSGVHPAFAKTVAMQTHTHTHMHTSHRSKGCCLTAIGKEHAQSGMHAQQQQQPASCQQP